MFFSRLAERTGLFDMLAPRRARTKSKREDTAAESEEHEKDELTQDAAAATKTLAKDVPSQPAPSHDAEREALERQQRQREERLESQRLREEEAKSRGDFVKKQRVRYLHKMSNTWYDAVVVGVHYDDGADHPYYTIKYRKNDSEPYQEKQTTADRLTRVPWNAEATWEILK